jgi:hypothetical protein
MTILETTASIDICEQQNGARYLIDRTTILLYHNIIQKEAYNRDLGAFLVWDNTILVKREMTFSSTGYTSAISGDITKTVVGDDSGATGTLVSYNNTTRVWIVTPVSGTFTATEAVTITTGTGAGTQESNEGYKGPYSISSSTKPCRKIYGVTTLSDGQLMNGAPIGQNFTTLLGRGVDDYGQSKSSNSPIYGFTTWMNGRIDNLNNTFTFLTAPVDTSEYYRLVYYMDAPTIEDEDDNDHFIIPERFRYSVIVGGVAALANNALYGDSPTTSGQILKPYLDAFWNAIDTDNAPTPGKNTNSNGFIAN